MEDEIDLRAYIEVLLRYKYWIAGLVVLAAVAAFVVTSLRPVMYEARSLILITQPRYELQFDSRFQTQVGLQTYKAVPELAMSDGVLQAVVDDYSPTARSGIEEWTLDTLWEMVEASSGSDISVVLLEVRSESAEDAAAIANVWARELVKRGRELYGQGEADITFFEEQLQQAQQKLQQAESALIEFQARNEASTVNARLESLRAAQAEHLANQRMVTYLIQDVQGLRAQLAQQAGSQAASPADALTVLLLQIKAFNATSSTPVMLQISGSGEFSEMTLAEQRALLEDLVVTLEAKSAEIDKQIAELSPQILALQGELQAISVESNQLGRDQEMASGTYKTLALKLQEAQISSQAASGTLQVGSEATIPNIPMARGRLINTIIAGMVAFLIAAMGAFLVDFWRGKAAQSERDSPALRTE
jgi:uncharacterized protein involved in exopolysaccharide biosynthesis